MALVKCPDCGRDVSTAATACPQCGRPMAAVAAPQPPAGSTKEERLWHGTPSWLLLLGKIIRAVIVAIVLPLIYYFGHDFLAQYSMIVWAIIAIAIHRPPLHRRHAIPAKSHPARSRHRQRDDRLVGQDLSHLRPARDSRPARNSRADSHKRLSGEPAAVVHESNVISEPLDQAECAKRIALLDDEISSGQTISLFRTA